VAWRDRLASQIQDIWLLLAALIWGSGFILTKIALDAGTTAAQLMAWRFSGAALVFGLLFDKHLRGLSRQDWLIGCSTGVLLFLGFMTQTVGLVYTTPSRNALLTAVYVVMVPFFSAIILKRRPGRRVFVGAVTGFIGVAILTVSFDDLNTGYLRGDILTLICAVFYAMHLIALEYSVRKVSIPRLIFLQMLATAICSLLVLPFDRASAGSVNLKAAVPAVLYLVLFSSCLAYFLQTRGQKHTPASRAAILLSPEALFGSLLSVAFGFDPFSARLVIGGLIVFGSILLVEWPSRDVA
jgi:drug/metabolite transporter (DMT)-like permease